MSSCPKDRRGPRASAGTFQRLARRITASLAIACFSAAVAPGQNSLDLIKVRSGKARDGEIELIVRGAQPHEPVTLFVDDRPEMSRALRAESLVADGAGFCRVTLSASLFGSIDRSMWAQAFTGSDRSNVVLLREFPSLYLLVDDVASRARLLRFDPRRGVLEPSLRQLDTDSVLAIAKSIPFVARDGALVHSDEEAVGALRVGERPIDLIASKDQSMLLALTREDFPQGRALLRLRLIETDATSHEIASLEILRGGGRLLSAWLVSDSDSHRVLIAEREGAIREVALGAEPERGVTILPLSPLVSEELSDVRIHGDLLVAVTRPGPVRSRRATSSRLLVFDLSDDHASPKRELTLDSVMVAFEVAERPQGPAAFVALESGALEIVPLDAQADVDTRRNVYVRRLALAPDGSLFGLQFDASSALATAVRIDTGTLAIDPLDIPPLSSRASQFGLFGDPSRSWLFTIQPQGLSLPDDELVCTELDPSTGRIVGETQRFPLSGHVRRVASR